MFGGNKIGVAFFWPDTTSSGFKNHINFIQFILFYAFHSLHFIVCISFYTFLFMHFFQCIYYYWFHSEHVILWFSFYHTMYHHDYYFNVICRYYQLVLWHEITLNLLLCTLLTTYYFLSTTYLLSWPRTKPNWYYLSCYVSYIVLYDEHITILLF